MKRDNIKAGLKHAMDENLLTPKAYAEHLVKANAGEIEYVEVCATAGQASLSIQYVTKSI